MAGWGIWPRKRSSTGDSVDLLDSLVTQANGWTWRAIPLGGIMVFGAPFSAYVSTTLSRVSGSILIRTPVPDGHVVQQAFFWLLNKIWCGFNSPDWPQVLTGDTETLTPA